MVINKTLKQNKNFFHIQKIKFTSLRLTRKPKILDKINNQTTIEIYNNKRNNLPKKNRD